MRSVRSIGTKKIYAFDDDMNLDIDGLKGFLAEHEGETIFLFGFTFMIWEYFYKALKEMMETDSNTKNPNFPLDLSNGVLIHGGGWKKLVNEAVSKEEFKAALRSVCDFGEEGVIEVLSAIPESYPGHAILTEDVGTVLGEDDCPCGRKGKYFSIHGRMAKAEVRGCSDTFEKK